MSRNKYPPPTLGDPSTLGISGRGRTHHPPMATLLIVIMVSLAITWVCAYRGSLIGNVVDYVTQPFDSVLATSGSAHAAWVVMPIPEGAEVFVRVQGDDKRIYRISQ